MNPVRNLFVKISIEFEEQNSRVGLAGCYNGIKFLTG